MEALTNLKLINRQIIGQYGIYDLDPAKITVSIRTTAMTGHELSEMLRMKFHIVVEMEAQDYVLGIASLFDTKEGFDRLGKALLAIDLETTAQGIENSTAGWEVIRTVSGMAPYEAMERKSEVVKLKESRGRIAAGFISLFPPGSPILVPGEIIEEELLQFIEQAKRAKLTITGLEGDKKDKIEVVSTSNSREG